MPTNDSSERRRSPFDRRSLIARRTVCRELDELLGLRRRPDLDAVCPRVSLREAA